METQASRRGYFFASLAGVVVGALLVSVVPAVARNGDSLVLGTSNRAGRSTWLASKGPSTLRLGNSGGNVALDLRVDPGAAPLAVNSDTLVDGLNADRVDGYGADQLTRVAYQQTVNAPDQNGVVVSATIEAPRRGFLVMTGSVDATNGTVADQYACQLAVDGDGVTGTWRRSMVDGPTGGSNTLNWEENCTTNGVEPVAAGTYTVELKIHNWDDTGMFFGDAAVWALYVPFDGAGNPPDIP